MVEKYIMAASISEKISEKFSSLERQLESDRLIKIAHTILKPAHSKPLNEHFRGNLLHLYDRVVKL